MNARWLLLLAVCAHVPALARGQDSAAIHQVLITEDQRFAAMEFADTVALGPLLAADLTYTHTDGDQNTRAEFLRSLSSGALKYRVIMPETRDVRVYGTIGVVVGRAAMRVESDGQTHAFKIRYLAVYRRGSRGWELMAWQSTRLPT